jgi:6-phosphofructokinase 1
MTTNAPRFVCRAARCYDLRMRRIGVLTSGGDAPGMNAAIRAVVRRALGRGLEVVGVRRGYAGLLAAELFPLTRAGVANIIQRGGTMLGTSRSERFRAAEGRARAAAVLREAAVDGLVAIGGDGTMRGASELAAEHGIPVVGVPGTIDNDVFGTDSTIGYDTAVNTAVEAIDRIRDTAASHDRLFLVEVMGRTCPDLALAVGTAGGAEDVLIGTGEPTVAQVGAELWKSWERGKRSSIIIVAEGDEPGRAFEVASRLKDAVGVEPRVCILGHIQRGGTPSARDRILGSRLGAEAVNALVTGGDVMVGESGPQTLRVPLRESWERKRPIPTQLLALVRELA